MHRVLITLIVKTLLALLAACQDPNGFNMYYPNTNLQPNGFVANNNMYPYTSMIANPPDSSQMPNLNFPDLLSPLGNFTSVVNSIFPQLTAQFPQRPQAPIPGPVFPSPPGPIYPSGGCHGGFSVRKAASNSLQATTRMRFQSIISNDGGWNSYTSQYQPPCNGYYYFSFSAVSAKNGDFTMALMKNNDYQVTAYGTFSDYSSASNSALLYCRTTDAIYLTLTEGQLYEHPYNEAYTTFTGFLVRAG